MLLTHSVVHVLSDCLHFPLQLPLALLQRPPYFRPSPTTCSHAPTQSLLLLTHTVVHVLSYCLHPPLQLALLNAKPASDPLPTTSVVHAQMPPLL
jgi:hypothetical protein